MTVEFFLVIVCGTVPMLKSSFDAMAMRLSRLTSWQYGKSSRRDFSEVSEGEQSSQTELAAVDGKSFSKSMASVDGHEYRVGKGQIRVQTTMNVDYAGSRN